MVRGYYIWKEEQKNDRVKRSKRTKSRYRQYKRFSNRNLKQAKKFLRSIGLKDVYGTPVKRRVPFKK